MRIGPLNTVINIYPVGCGDTDDADDAHDADDGHDADDADDVVVRFVLSLAIFSASQSSVQVQRTKSTEELDLAASPHMPPQAQCKANES